MGVDLIMKSSLVRKTLDNITVLFVAFENFENFINKRNKEYEIYQKQNLKTDVNINNTNIPSIGPRKNTNYSSTSRAQTETENLNLNNNNNNKLPLVLNTEVNFRKSENKKNRFKNIFNEGDEFTNNNNNKNLNNINNKKESSHKMPNRKFYLEKKKLHSKNIEENYNNNKNLNEEISFDHIEDKVISKKLHTEI